METRPTPYSTTPIPELTLEELTAFQADCRNIAARGGETGALAARMLSVSEKMHDLNETIGRFLKTSPQ